MWKPRSYYEQMAERHGLVPVENVTKTTSMLVTTEPDRASTKMTKAKKLGIRILTLSEWMDEIGEE